MSKIIYLDNAATSFPKPRAVLKETARCIKEYCGNPGRSSHYLSIKAAEAIYEAREAVSTILNTNKPENVVFTQNATYALNIALKSFIPENSHIIISDMEHNSVIRPLNWLKKHKGVDFSVFNASVAKGSDIEALITDKTYAICSNITSNVTGEEVSLKLLSDVAKKNKLLLILDASQQIGHKDIDLNLNQPCILCAPGHKALFGIQGCGFLVFTEYIDGKTLIEGGSGTNSRAVDMPSLLPERYEAGTLPTPSVVSLRYGIDFIRKYGIDNVSKRLSMLSLACSEHLKEFSDIKIHGTGCGIVAFSMDKLPSETLATALTRHGVCIRGGLHCAPLIHKRLGTEKAGLARVSFSIFNKESDIKSLCDALIKIKREC